MTSIHHSVVPIPKKLHLIWVGDDAKRPDAWIKTWKDNHAGWEFKLWGNAELNSVPWQAQKQIERFRTAECWSGVADLMRYEILFEHGGVYVDADSSSVRPLDDWLLDCRMFATWESEKHRPSLVANGNIGSVVGHPALNDIIKKTSRMNWRVWNRAWTNPLRWEETSPWIKTGPLFFTKMIMPYVPKDVTILPSVLFLPRHHFDQEERQSSLIYARQHWATTHKAY